MFKRKLSALDYGRDYNPQGKDELIIYSIPLMNIIFKMKINFDKWWYGLKI
jgi:hypothetical protein